MTFGSSGTYLNTSIPGLGIYDRRKISGGSNNTPNLPSGMSPVGGKEHHFECRYKIFSSDIHEITSQDMQGVKEAILLARQQRASLKDDLSKIKRNLTTTRLKKTLSYVFLYGLIQKSIPESLAQDIKAQQEAIEEANEQIENSYVKIDADFDPDIRQKYGALISAFHDLSQSQRIWDVTSRYFEDRRLTRSSASTSVTRRAVRFSQRSLPEVKSDLQGLYFQNANGADLYVYPSFIIMHTNQSNVAVIGLDEINFQYSAVRFVEKEIVPSDSKIIDYTWAKVNKNGTPDRRFKDNYQIPIVRYGEIRLKTKTGLHEEYKFSNYEAVEAFCRAFDVYRKSLPGLDPADTLY